MIFLGTFENRMDAKGRISFPAAFRALIHRSASREIALFPSFRYDNALEGMPAETLTAMADQQEVAEVDLFTKAKANRYSILFRTTHRLSIDDAGRINLPDSFVAHAGLEKSVVFSGEGHSFVLWSPAVHSAQMATDLAALKTPRDGLAPSVDLATAARTGQQATP